ncbi:MAG: hypothetical protein GY772_31115 [bacterium]|nr:hypothetical protein [bacterium]
MTGDEKDGVRMTLKHLREEQPVNVPGHTIPGVVSLLRLLIPPHVDLVEEEHRRGFRGEESHQPANNLPTILQGV